MRKAPILYALAKLQDKSPNHRQSGAYAYYMPRFAVCQTYAVGAGYAPRPVRFGHKMRCLREADTITPPHDHAQPLPLWVWAALFFSAGRGAGLEKQGRGYLPGLASGLHAVIT